MKPWPLDSLLKANRNAAGVYLALRWLAGKKRCLATTRRRIAEICPMHEDTISKAMRALADAGWIVLNYGRAGGKQWYRVSFPATKQQIFPGAVETGHRKKKQSHSNRPQGTIRCGRLNRPLFSKENKGANTPGLNGPDASALHNESQGVRREREFMEEKQRRRKGTG